MAKLRLVFAPFWIIEGIAKAIGSLFLGSPTSKYINKRKRIPAFNCARVYVGDYPYSKIHTYPEEAPGGTWESCESAHCGYKVLRGNVITKGLRLVKVGQHILQTLALYPTTDKALIAIYTKRGRHLVKLLKPDYGSRDTIFKARL